MRKRTLTIGSLALAFSACLPSGSGWAAEESDPYIFNPLTGVALNGYDTVSYFTDTAPGIGRPDHEYVWAGLSWYFISEANRDVFMRAPAVYAPRFGGRCLTSLSRGYLSDGDPRLYAIYRQRLYLFHSVGNREAFLLARTETLATAERHWAELRATIPPR